MFGPNQSVHVLTKPFISCAKRGLVRLKHILVPQGFVKHVSRLLFLDARWLSLDFRFCIMTMFSYLVLFGPFFGGSLPSLIKSPIAHWLHPGWLDLAAI